LVTSCKPCSRALAQISRSAGSPGKDAEIPGNPGGEEALVVSLALGDARQAAADGPCSWRSDQAGHDAAVLGDLGADQMKRVCAVRQHRQMVRGCVQTGPHGAD